jgi:DNA (cytosine-5)-methyltransferase 1
MRASVQLVSLFSGAGGLDLAFDNVAGYETALMVESNSVFAETLRVNQKNGRFKNAIILQDDIKNINPKTHFPINKKSDKFFGLIGGPPCEAFSTMGRRKALDDDRGMLIFEFARWADNEIFDFILFENVPEIERISDGKVFRRLCEVLSCSGYRLSHGVLNAADYGAATTRKRMFILGRRAGASLQMPPPTHSKEPSLFEAPKKPWVTSAGALAGLPQFSIDGDKMHVCVQHNAAVTERFAQTKPGGYDNVRKRSRLHPEKPSPSLVAGNLGGTRNHIHPLFARELTNREIARIQGFPDDYVFSGSTVAIAKQITNAVPVPLGSAFAHAIIKSLRGFDDGGAKK